MDNQTPSVAQKLSPKFFFLSLGALVTLISSVSYVLVLFFDILEQKFPDALNAVYQYGYNSYNFDGIRGAIATLIILFPVFLVISYFWNKSSEGEMGKIDITIKKWMIYLILFMASVVVVVDLITLVRYFVSGEITFRFILKVLLKKQNSIFLKNHPILLLFLQVIRADLNMLLNYSKNIPNRNCSYLESIIKILFKA